jgi:hypothetical protein
MNKIKRYPSREFPELTTHMAKISRKSYELYELTKPETMARIIGIARQNFQALIDRKVIKEPVQNVKPK